MRHLILLIFMTSSAYAQFSSSQHQFGLVLDYWTYKEPVIKDSGLLYGLHYRYQTALNSTFDWSIGGEYILGETEYDGETLGTGTPVTADQNNSILQVYSLIGIRLSSTIKPLLGVSFRYLNDKDDESTGDYQREQTYITFPVGFSINLTSSQITFLYHAGFQGTNKTHLTDVGGSPDLTLEQDEGSGLHLEWEFFFNKTSITAFYRSWDVEDSEIKFATVPGVTGNNFLEPENDTESIGLRFNTLF